MRILLIITLVGSVLLALPAGMTSPSTENGGVIPPAALAYWFIGYSIAACVLLKVFQENSNNAKLSGMLFGLLVVVWLVVSITLFVLADIPLD